MSAAGTKTLFCRFPHSDARCRLICFPWAGGGANFYVNWGKLVPETIEVTGVCLPGREQRFKDKPYSKVTDVLQEIVPAIATQCKDKPFAFWGHSLGAILSYLTAVELKKQHGLEPVKMFVSGVSAPHSPKRKSIKINASQYNDDEFIEYLRKLGGTPREVLDNKELMSLFLPSLRADYTLLDDSDTNIPPEGPILSCPIRVFDGEDDIEHDLEAWKEVTSSDEFSVQKLPGGHFYLKESYNANTLLTHICMELR